MNMLNEHLEHRINQLLLSNDDLSSQRITVTAKDGQVVLDGRVQSFRRKLAAQEIVEADDNVTGVLNELVVVSPTDCSDAEIALRINETLDRSDDLTGESIRVDSKAGKVTLTGYVGTERKRVRSADLAASVDNVNHINNLLVVNPDRVAANQEHAHVILNSLAQVIGMENERISLSIVDETARLSGVVDSAWKKNKAESVVGQHEIMHVANEITVVANRQ